MYRAASRQKLCEAQLPLHTLQRNALLVSEAQVLLAQVRLALTSSATDGAAAGHLHVSNVDPLLEQLAARLNNLKRNAAEEEQYLEALYDNLQPLDGGSSGDLVEQVETALEYDRLARISNIDADHLQILQRKLLAVVSENEELRLVNERLRENVAALQCHIESAGMGGEWLDSSVARLLALGTNGGFSSSQLDDVLLDSGGISCPAGSHRTDTCMVSKAQFDKLQLESLQQREELEAAAAQAAACKMQHDTLVQRQLDGLIHEATQHRQQLDDAVLHSREQKASFDRVVADAADQKKVLDQTLSAMEAIAVSHKTEVDQLVADAVDRKVAYDQVQAAAVEHKAQYDQLLADAVLQKATFDTYASSTTDQLATAAVNAIEQKGQYDQLVEDSTAAKACHDKLIMDSTEAKACHDKLVVDTEAQKVEHNRLMVHSTAVKAALDKANVDATHQKQEFDQLMTDSAAVKSALDKAHQAAACQKQEFDQLVIDSAAVKSALDKAHQDAVCQKQEFDQLVIDSTAVKSAFDKANLDAAAQKQEFDQLVIDSAAVKSALDKASADAVTQKHDFDQLVLDSALVKSTLDQAVVDAAENKVIYDKLVMDSTNAKACHDKLIVDSNVAKACHDKLIIDSEQAKAVHDKLIVDTAVQADLAAARNKATVDQLAADNSSQKTKLDSATNELDRLKNEHKRLIRHQEVLQAELQMAMESYVPKARIDSGTPADKMLCMMTELLEGTLPTIQDILFVQSAILESHDVYQPIDLNRQLMNDSCRLDEDVSLALIAQLGRKSSKTNGPAVSLAEFCNRKNRRRPRRPSASSQESDSSASALDDSGPFTTLEGALTAIMTSTLSGGEGGAGGHDALSTSLGVVAEPRQPRGPAGVAGSSPLSHATRRNSAVPCATCGPTTSSLSSATLSSSQAPLALSPRWSRANFEGAAGLGPEGGAVIGPAPPILEEVEQVLSTVNNWQFDAFKLHQVTRGHPLSTLAYFLFHEADLIKKFELSPVLLARALRRLEDGYRVNNPYHSATHAADVLQSMHTILHRGGMIPGYVDPLTLMACYVAALVHDYEHVGLTNDFLIGTGDALAVRYNDKAPLENHHCASAFAVLKHADCNFLAHLAKADQDKLRKLVIELVLGTDMKQHFGIVSQFKTVHRLGGNESYTPSVLSDRSGTQSVTNSQSAALAPGVQDRKIVVPLDEAERLLSLQLALKCADIGHVAAFLPVHLRWVSCLEEEFFCQGDQEKLLGMPISPLFDRTKQGISKSQLGFLDIVCIPLLHEFTRIFTPARPMLTYLMRNYKYWTIQLEQSNLQADNTKLQLPQPSRPPMVPATAGNNKA